MDTQLDAQDLEDTGLLDSFLFEDYFADDSNRGTAITILYDGKLIPFRVKKVLTVREKQKANDVALEFEITEQGEAKVKKIDQAAYNIEIVMAGLKWWPFEFQPGKPVPITRKYIEKLDGTLIDLLASRILRIGEVQVASLDPFGKKSEDHSSQEDQQDQS